MKLVVTRGGARLEFTPPGSGGEFPWLSKVGTLAIVARAGHLDGAVVESESTLEFDLDNTARQAATLLGHCVRATAEVYDDNGELFFFGLIQRVTYDAMLAGSIEA